MSKRYAILFLCALSLNAEDDIYELKADIANIKNEVTTLKSLAEQEKPNSFNPSIALVGDIMSQYRFNKNDHHHNNHDHHHHDFINGIFLRELELEFRGDVDPYADALASIALHQGHDHVDIHVEEVYLRLKKWPILGYAPFNIKLGQFKAALGRMNRIHLHNIPQVYYPKALSAFLGDEGYSAPGISLDRYINIYDKSSLHLVIEGSFTKPLPLQSKGSENIPKGIFHAWWHQEFKAGHFLDLGMSHLFTRLGDKDSGLLYLLVADVHYSFLNSAISFDPIVTLGNELFLSNKSKNSDMALGNIFWAQARILNNTFLGVKYDLSPKAENMAKLEHALGSYLSYYTSEFLRFRLGYEHVMPKVNSFSGEDSIMLSSIFILGSHPNEPYFINR